MNQPSIQLLDALGAEFRRVAAEHEATAPRRRRRFRRTRPLLVALAALAMAGGAVAALTTREDKVDVTGLFGARDRVTIAEGTTVAGSHWTLTSGRLGDFRRAGSARRKPTGGRHDSFCLSLAVVGTRGPEASIMCGPITHGWMAPGHFGVGSAEDSAGGAGLLFGTVPDKAATVAIHGRTFSQQVRTIEDGAGIPGRFFVIGSSDDFRRTTMVFRDGAGKPLHKPDTVWHLQRWEIRGDGPPF